MAEKYKPQPSPGYFGMLALTALSMLIGVVCLVIEATEYDWEPKPKATEKIALPTSAPKGIGSLPLPAKDYAEAKPTVVKPEVAAVVELPKVAPMIPPVVAVKPEEPKPVPTGPTPSPLAFPTPKATTVPVTTEEPKPGQPTPSPLRIGK